MGTKLTLGQIKLLRAKYGKNWKEALQCIPLPEERKRITKAKRKQAKKSRRQNRKN